MDNFLRIKDKKFNKTFRSETFFSYLQLLNKKELLKRPKCTWKSRNMRLVFSIFFALLILFFVIFLLTPLSALSRDFVSYSLAATCNYVITSTLILFKALLSNRSQMTSKCGKNISDTLGCASCATFSFLPHFDVICDLLLNRRTATWNLFVKYT